MTKELTLYHFAGTSSFASNLVLAWTGQTASVVKPDASYHTSVNPAVAVPSLVLPDGTVLTQTIAVLSYLAKKANRIDLVGGDDLIDQAQVLKWSSFFASDVHGSFWVVFFTNRYTTSTDPESIAQVKTAGLQMVQKKFAIVEKHMKDRAYLVTEHKTIADAHLYSILRWTIPNFPDMMKELPNLTAFAERMAEDEGTKVALKYEDNEKYGM